MLVFVRIVVDVVGVEVKIWCNSVNQGRFFYVILVID